MNKSLEELLKSEADLVTTRSQTRAGFVSFALEKSRRATPLIAEAKSLKCLAARAKTPEDLLNIKEIQNALLTASGLSDKALNYFTERDKDDAISELIEKFLKPAGENFVDEMVYRFLLIRGDTLGGSMRNIVGTLAQQKLVRNFISVLSIGGFDFDWYDGRHWNQGNRDCVEAETAKAIYWNRNGDHRILAFNVTINIVKNNVDICLFDATKEDSIKEIVKNCNNRAIMFGELKGGIDPAGADEHWKTGNTALERIRTAFYKIGRENIRTAFIAAAIEKKMAQEIYFQLINGVLDYAINLTVDNQLVSFCEWLAGL